MVIVTHKPSYDKRQRSKTDRGATETEEQEIDWSVRERGVREKEEGERQRSGRDRGARERGE